VDLGLFIILTNVCIVFITDVVGVTMRFYD